MVFTVINMGNRAQGEEMTVNPQYQHGMQPVFHKSGVMGSTVKVCNPAFNIFDTGVTQASISFKNDCKISQSSAEFETHAIDSLNYSLLIGYGWAQTFLS